MSCIWCSIVDPKVVVSSGFGVDLLSKCLDVHRLILNVIHVLFTFAFKCLLLCFRSRMENLRNVVVTSEKKDDQRAQIDQNVYLFIFVIL